MTASLIVALLCVAVVASAITLEDVPAMSIKNGGAFTPAETRSLWKQFQAKYGNVAEREHSARFAAFKQNLLRIAEQNSRPGETAVFGINKFAALSAAEFSAKYLMKNMGPAPVVDARMVGKPLVADTGSSFSWLDANPAVVTAVKNQEQCGSCWAFSATENIESIWAIGGNALPTLAPQQIVDCDTKMDGCNGGWPVNAIQYIIANGQESENSYPYTAVDGSCKYNSKAVVAQPSSWMFATKDKNETLMALNMKSYGPLSIAVDAADWQTYLFGVLRHCGQTIDHGVQVVGYANVGAGTLLNPAYWLVRNSWGSTWGEAGYIKVEYGKNLCDIAAYPATASLSHSASSTGHSGHSGHPSSSSTTGTTTTSSSSGFNRK